MNLHGIRGWALLCWDGLIVRLFKRIVGPLRFILGLLALIGGQ